ncbi:MAG: DUF4373 domain-containing protein [Clostridia bacterium]|nr:DUF4373 domain-containing protein [Clostridia bacterium]
MMDSKFRRIKQKYGYLAPYTYQIILTMIYKDKGYYLDTSNMEDLSFDILEYLQGKYMPKAETVIDMIADFVACGLFSRDLYETEHILTSRRIQEEYYNSTSKRRAVTVNKRYWLLSVEDMKGISSRSSILSIFISDGINDISDGINKINDGKSTQRREDKSRSEEIREDQIRGREEHACAPAVAAVCLHFQKVFSHYPTTGFASEIERYLQAGMTENSIKNDISKAALKKPKAPIPYVLGMLRSAYQRQKPVYVDPDNIPLADWEKDWQEEYQAMCRKMEKSK